MKFIVAGSRTFTDYSKAKSILDLKIDKGDTIISGTARGADRLGERYAKENGIDLIKMPAKWQIYGKSAGYIRNTEMAKVGDVLITFWNGSSRGTMHMINIAKDHGLEVNVVNI
jgi:hypothetical protein